MTIRALTDTEHNTLAHIVVDPNAWWAHVNAVESIDSEQVLAAKVERHQSDYDDAAALDGYMNRAERDAADAADAAERDALKSA